MKVITAVVNNPIFIEIQYYTLKKHMKCDYEFIVFNDAKQFPDYSNGNDVTIYNKIIAKCDELGIKYINVPNGHHAYAGVGKCSATRCAEANNFIKNYQLEHPDKYLCIDSDMFLINDFDVKRYENYKCAVVLHKRCNESALIYYIWNGIYYFDISKMEYKELLNWNTCINNGLNCDVGGMMNQWYMTCSNNYHPEVDTLLRFNNREDDLKDINNNFEKQGGIYYIDAYPTFNWNYTKSPEFFRNNPKLVKFVEEDPRNPPGNYFCEIYDNTFLHYRAGGNWMGDQTMDLHNKLAEKLKHILIEDS